MRNFLVHFETATTEGTLNMNGLEILLLIILLILLGLGVYAYPVAGIPLLVCFFVMLELVRRRRRAEKQKSRL